MAQAAPANAKLPIKLGAKPRSANEEATGQQSNNRSHGVAVGEFECLLCDTKWRANGAKYGVAKECYKCQIEVLPTRVVNVRIKHRSIHIQIGTLRIDRWCF